MQHLHKAGATPSASDGTAWAVRQHTYWPPLNPKSLLTLILHVCSRVDRSGAASARDQQWRALHAAASNAPALDNARRAHNKVCTGQACGSYLVDDHGARCGRGGCGVHDRLLRAAQQRGRRVRAADVRRGACRCTALAQACRRTLLCTRGSCRVDQLDTLQFKPVRPRPGEFTSDARINAW